MSRTFEARLREAGLGDVALRDTLARIERVDAALRATDGDVWLRAPTGTLFVPGRIEVLGKHTDYAGGRSLVCACERGFVARWRARRDGRVRVVDAGRGATVELAPETGDDPPGDAPHWATYVSATTRRLRRHFPDACLGIDIALASDLPPASGLSSSSALVITVALALIESGGLREHGPWRENISGIEDLAGYLATIENGHAFGSLEGDAGVGTFGGSEDHVAILTSVAGTLAQWSFCPARLERRVALPDGLVFVVGASGVAAEKTGAARDRYNRAAWLARDLVATWNRVTGRADTTLAEACGSAPEAVAELRTIVAVVVDDEGLRRALLARLDQFAEESLEIVPAASVALARGDIGTFGTFVLRSHLAAIRGLQNVVPETAALVELARESGAHAASAFGAGFGGSVWALVEAADAAAFTDRWRRRYLERFAARASSAFFFVTGAGPAAVLP